MEGAAQVPWDRIISAAAASTLGIVSLALLIVAVVAVLLFRGSGDRTRLIVFGAVVAMALVGLAVAVLRERGDAAPVGVAPDLAPSATAAESPEPSAGASGDVAAGNASTTADPAATGTADLSGMWHSSDGFAYRVTIEGNRFAYTELFEGDQVGTGEGTIEGRRLRYRYINERTLDRGECNALLSADRTAIDGTCGNGEDEWGFRIERDGG
jgi:hypothetical protein